MKYLLSVLTICAVINTAQAFDYKGSDGEALRKRLENSQALAKQYEGMAKRVTETGELSPEDLQTMMNAVQGIAKTYGVEVPKFPDAKKMIASSEEYRACVDKAEGAGTSQAIINHITQPNAMDMVKRALTEAKKLCERGRRDVAQTFLDNNLQNYMKRYFPKQYNTLQRCEQLSSYQSMKIHPCDT